MIKAFFDDRDVDDFKGANKDEFNNNRKGYVIQPVLEIYGFSAFE